MYWSRMSLFLLSAKSMKRSGLVSLGKCSLQPKTPLQSKYLSLLNDPSVSVVLGMGPAGTGKTLLACHAAIDLLKQKKVEKIIVTRPFVSVDENIGFLPGSMSQKMDPFTRPLFDIFSEYYSRTQIDKMIKENTIEISPLGFMRGRTFKKCFIVADEMQNSSPSQMKMLLTRLGDECRLAITGDLAQSDLGEKNGLWDFYSRIRGREDLSNIQWVEFLEGDIQRSAVVSTIVSLYREDC